MWFPLWAISVVAVAALISWCFLHAIQDSYEERIEQIRSEEHAKQEDLKDLVFRRDKEITNLTLENITLTNDNDQLETKLKDLTKHYDIKTSMCLGLQKNARLWHESYEELESHIDEVRERCAFLVKSKEEEHQKEIEDLTRYYKEKILKYTHPVEGGTCQNAD